MATSSVSRILIVEKGFGSSRLPLLKSHLPQEVQVQIPIVPEPTDDLESGVQLLCSAIKEFNPDVLIGSSRGGKLVAELIKREAWKGPTVLISAMSTSECCKSHLPIVLAHGTQDVTIPLQLVELDVDACKSNTIKLHKYEDDHSLRSIFESGEIRTLIEEAYSLRDSVETTQKASPLPSRADMLSQIKLRKKN